MESANVEWDTDETHGGPVDVDHVLVKGLNVIVVYSYTATLIEEWKIVIVAGTEHYLVETTTTPVHEFYLLVVLDVGHIGPETHVGWVIGVDRFGAVVT